MCEVTTINVSLIKITAVNQDTGAVCISMNDPYIVTFDGRYYEMFYEGEYVIYAHTELPYEVHHLLFLSLFFL